MAKLNLRGRTMVGEWMNAAKMLFAFSCSCTCECDPGTAQDGSGKYNDDKDGT